MRRTRNTAACRQRSAAFSLIEMLAVLSIVGILAAMSVPVLSSMSNSAGRKGAVNLMLNSFEQARVAALSSGVNAYVGFANESAFDSSDSPYPYRSFIIFRDRTDDDPGTNQYVPLTKWIFLPDRISFWSESYSVIGTASDIPYTITLSDESLPHVGTGKSLPVVAFNSSGAIQHPTDTTKLRLFIYEGFFSGGTNNRTNPDQTYLERITFQRFTGRAEWNVSPLSN